MPDCPIASQVGEISFEVANSRAGQSAISSLSRSTIWKSRASASGRAGFQDGGLFTGLRSWRVRARRKGLTVTTPEHPEDGETHNIMFTIWGIPAAARTRRAARRDLRQHVGEDPPLCRNEFGAPQPAHIPVKPFLSNPTSCGTFKRA